MRAPAFPARRRFVAACTASLGTAVLGFGPLPVAAQGAFPSKTLSVVVPYPAGGANDMLGRLIGQKMAEALGGTAMVELLKHRTEFDPRLKTK